MIKPQRLIPAHFSLLFSSVFYRKIATAHQPVFLFLRKPIVSVSPILEIQGECV